MKSIFKLLVLTLLIAACGKDPSPAPVSQSCVKIGMPARSGVIYNWTPTSGLDNPNIAQPMACPLSSTVYTQHARTECGEASSSALVKAMRKLPSGEIIEVK